MTSDLAQQRLVEDERGMTLVEVLIGTMAGLVVLMLGFAMWDGAMKMQTRTADRIDAVARGRTSMERITRDLRSQQCLDSNTPAMIWAADLGMEFYSSVAQETATAQPVERRRLEWVKDSKQFSDGGAAVGDIVETVWGTNQTQAPYTFNILKRKQVLAEDVQQDTQSNGAPIPIFQYTGYDTGKVGRPSTTPFPLVAMTANGVNTLGRGVATANLSRIVLVDVRYLARARRTKSGKSFPVLFANRVSVRTADPSDPLRSPLCL